MNVISVPRRVLSLAQAILRKELAAETEKNQDDISHLKLLKKHFQEREEAYQVIPHWCVLL
jgi:hypothetical protein